MGWGAWGVRWRTDGGIPQPQREEHGGGRAREAGCASQLRRKVVKLGINRWHEAKGGDRMSKRAWTTRCRTLSAGSTWRV